MVNRIRYVGRRDDGQIMYLTINAKEAIEKGKTYTINGYEMHLTESDTLSFYMHKYCPYLDVKINYEYNYTIKELYNLCPAILLDLLELNGGTEYLAQILIGYEELYNQEQIVKEWQENPQS